jgi:hypothetical protein
MRIAVMRRIIPRMTIPEFLKEWGHLLVQNPIAFVVFAGIIGAVAWRVARSVYSAQVAGLREQIEILKLRRESPAVKPSLNQGQYGRIVRALGKYPIRSDNGNHVRTVEINIELGVTENENFASQLKDAIGDAGWSVRIGRTYPSQSFTKGIWIIGPDSRLDEPPNTRKILKMAFAEAGLKAQEQIEGFLGYNDPWLAFVLIGKPEG